MAIKKLFAVSAISLAVGFMSATAFAEADGDGFVEDYVTNPYGEVWKNSYGECWRDRFQNTDVKLEECGYVAPAEEVVAVAVVCEDQVIISDLLFAFDSAKLTEADIASLSDEVAHVRKINNDECDRVTGARIVGHTDSIGPAEYNQQLSERRAAAVRDYLETQEGVTRHMEAVGMGETAPIADNSTKEGRAQNRRVVIELLYN